MNHLAFVCAHEETDPDEIHITAIAMRRCDHCGAHSVAGYICDCGHSDMDPTDQLVGHGPGKCPTVAVAAPGED